MRLVLAFGLFAAAWSPVSAQQTLQQQLRSTLTSLPHAQTRASAHVIDLRTGRTVFSRAADTPMVPASALKLFVMAAALEQLGSDFQFETVLATDGSNLYVIGGGDPGFGDEKLGRRGGESITTVFERWSGRLVEQNHSTLPGDLVLDESVFDDQWLHPTWEESDLGKWYAAPVGALNYNNNCIDITVEPAAREGDPVRVSVQPETSLVNIINNCRTGEGTPILHHPHDTFDYFLRGCCNRRWPFVSVSFPDPGLLFADSFRTTLRGRGIVLGGETQRRRVRRPDGTLPASLNVLARHQTPLIDVIQRIGKDSQNLFAEALLKRLGYEWAKRTGQRDAQGSWPTGARAILDHLDRTGIDTTNLRIADGSGLSRENLCTTRQLSALLADAHRRPWGALLHESLSVSGVDGSLRNRLTNEPGLAHAKTGTMRGVRALAGYINTDPAAAGSPRYAFAVIFNDYPGPSTPYRRIQDRFCRILAAAAEPATIGE